MAESVAVSSRRKKRHERGRETNVVTQVVLRQGEVERGTPSLVVPKGRVLPGVKEL
jgi:hypothetical protein